MEFDRSAVRHPLAIAPWAPGEFDVFVLSDDGTVEHFWATGGAMFGPEPLGGVFSDDPEVVWEFDETGQHLHLIGRSGSQVVDWRWDGANPTAPLGPPVVETLPGFCLTRPVVVSSGRAEVYGVGVEGSVRHWAHTPDGWLYPEDLGPGVAISPPVVVYRPGVVDVFAVGSDNANLQHWWNQGGGWLTESRGGAQLVGRPTVVSYATDRLDVFALRADGAPVHWGKVADRWFDAEARLDLSAGTTTVVPTDQLALVTFGVDRLMLFSRSTTGDLLEWTLQPPDGWAGVNPFSSAAHPFVAWSGEQGRVDTLHRSDDGTFTWDVFVNDPEHGMGEPVAGGWDSATFEPLEPAPPPQPLPSAPVAADLVLRRPRDLVLLGLHWEGFTVQTGPPAALVAGAGAVLTAVFPPQHVVEEVAPADGAAVPSLDPASTGGFPTWQAGLAGASRVAVAVTDGAVVPLTVDGVLDALRTGTVVPSTGVLDARTAIELPYQLLISPIPVDGGAIRAHHPSAAVTSAGGTVGIWQTDLRADGVAAGRPAGLLLQALDAGSSDPFPVALSGAARARIVLETPTARIDRLSLSALGGTLTAAGAWDTFDWEHVAAVGRDRRVRTSTRGVLFPFGHRAEYVETTERVFTTGAEGAVAVLRQATVLRITDAVRAEPDDPALRAAFPFSEVVLEASTVTGLDVPAWETQAFPTPEAEALQSNLDQWRLQLDDTYTVLYGDMGPGGDTPPVEDLAAGVTADAQEPADPDAPVDPDDPDGGRTRAAVAREYLDVYAQWAHVKTQLAALPHGGVQPLPVFFVPRQAGQPVPFPVRLVGRLGDVHVTLPLVFVADIDRATGLLSSEFVSLTDAGIAARLATTWAGLGDGVAEVGGTRVDLVRAETPEPADVCEVQRLHLVGVAHDGNFRPRLGAPPAADEPRRPAADRWGFDVVLPAVRTMLGADRPPLRMALSRDVLDRVPDLEIPFQIPDGVDDLVTTFAQNTVRSGGISAPDIVADGISRLHGPVNVAGLLDAVDGHLDPRKVLGDGASLLGFDLADLIDASALTVPPAIHAAPPPSTSVSLQWRAVKLATDSGPFVTGPDSLLDLDVVIGADGQDVTCTVHDVVLALPDRDPPGDPASSSKLVEVSFGTIEFTQHGDRPPHLDVSGVGAEFFGALQLVKELAEAVDLGDEAPQLDISAHGITASYALPIPDVAAGAFQLTGLVLHAGIDVPFDGRPVTISLGFASRAKPFNLSVLMFGGGGYVEVEIDRSGLKRLELALEFGAAVAVDFVVAYGEVHALGGISMTKVGDDLTLTGYLRLGGSVSVFGLVSVSVELQLSLGYDSATNEMFGRATLVLEIDLTLFSESVELDSGRWVLAGSSAADEQFAAPPAPEFAAFSALGAPVAPLPLDAAQVPDDWARYRAAFAPGSVPR